MASIRALVPAVALAPTLALLGFAGLFLSDRWTEYSSGVELRNQVRLAVVAGEFAHNLQLERGRATFQTQVGTGDVGAVQQAYIATDHAAAALRARLTRGAGRMEKAEAARNARLLAAMDQIKTLRADVAQHRSNATAVFQRYTSIINGDLALVNDVSRRGGALSPEVGRDLAVYAALANGKEFAGNERAIGAIALSAPTLNPGAMALTVALAGGQEGAFRDIPRLASPAFAARWKAFIDSPEALAIKDMRIKVVGDTGRPPSVSPATWFSLTSARINALHKLEGAASAEALARIDSQVVAANRGLAIAFAVTFFAIVGAIAAAVWVARTITRPLARVTSATHSLASGDLDAQLEFSGGPDEIVAMAEALGVFRANLQANEALTRELAQADRMASLGALVAGIAHEVNTPVGNALMVSSSLSESVGQFKGEVESGALRRSMLEQHLDTAQEAARLLELNLTRASEQIRSFKQIAVDQTSDHRRAFNLKASVDDAVRSCTPVLRQAGVTIRCDVAPDIDLESYPGALSQVVINLVENAVKHGLPNVADGQVRIEAHKLDGGHVRMTVSDNGVGIPEQLRDKVFGAFFTTREASGGAGLGLHIVKSIVSGQLGGDIALEVSREGGAQFSISLPLTAPANAPANTLASSTHIAPHEAAA